MGLSEQQLSHTFTRWKNNYNPWILRACLFSDKPTSQASQKFAMGFSSLLCVSGSFPPCRWPLPACRTFLESRLITFITFRYWSSSVVPVPPCRCRWPSSSQTTPSVWQRKRARRLLPARWSGWRSSRRFLRRRAVRALTLKVAKDALDSVRRTCQCWVRLQCLRGEKECWYKVPANHLLL